MTELPSLIPYRRRELLATRSRTQLSREFRRVTRHTLAPRTLLRPADDVAFGASTHPLGLTFHFDAITRARAHHLSNPTAIVAGWGAAAYVGLPFWADDAHTTLLGTTRRRQSRSVYTPTLMTHHIDTAITPDPLFSALLSVPAEHATIECLQDIAQGRHRWVVTKVPGLTDLDVLSVQLIDAMRRFTPLDVSLLPEAAANLYDSRRLDRLVKLSRGNSDSPPETTLRLIAEPLFPDVETQIPVFSGEMIVTMVDVGWRTKKVALFYDGAHHLHRSQRDYDSEVLAIMNDLGWKTLRVTYGMLRNPQALRERIRRML